MNNDEILEKIRNNTEFKNIQKICESNNKMEDAKIRNNLYLVSK